MMLMVPYTLQYSSSSSLRAQGADDILHKNDARNCDKRRNERAYDDDAGEIPLSFLGLSSPIFRATSAEPPVANITAMPNTPMMSGKHRLTAARASFPTNWETNSPSSTDLKWPSTAPSPSWAAQILRGPKPELRGNPIILCSDTFGCLGCLELIFHGYLSFFSSFFFSYFTSNII